MAGKLAMNWSSILSFRLIPIRCRCFLAATTTLAAVTSVLLFSGSAHATPVPTLPAPDYVGLREALNNVVDTGSRSAFALVGDRGGHGGTVSVGTGDLTTRAPVDPQGRFRVGSITKNLTAVLTLQLVARHQVDLDTRAADYLPSGVLPTASLITVRQLLSTRAACTTTPTTCPGS